ncbi:DUF1127 domain-containing protein [Microvirga sp. P5_D2]
MTYATGSMHHSEQSEYAWIAPAALVCATKAGRYFVSQMRRAAALERTRKELSELDARGLHDIGLEPLDVYYGWRGSPRMYR